ncbi:phospholipase D-like domain-containing protein [Nocardioides daeguensis]|uniref:phospholipase D-like domain-containing protein n=1 Tax=Nocardioides daeguensis TaxID=908359 RepID=UPI001C464EB4|nr:phospholipase D-like domain-containing protein [Nocardioides daeguensis]MBV6726356.1 hypothetical protein [Nocardioides daeguensis]MCR1772199.1 hypothetical protein [Nocardioides daeguensis]
MATAMAMVVVAAVLSVIPAGSARASSAADADGRRVAARAVADPGYVVAPGIVFNHPFRKKNRARIQRKIINTVRNVPAGETIRLATWNFDSPRLEKVFVNAHRRGVSVQIVMSRGLARTQGAGGSYRILRSALAAGNADRPSSMRSWIRTCRSTCRGGGGAMHFKFMLVSRSGATSWVVSQGSGNFTGAAAVQQFNDWTTVTENKALWDGWTAIWNEAVKDRDFPAARFSTGGVTSVFAAQG